MSSRFVAFDEIRRCLDELLGSSPELPNNIESVYLVRDLFGKIRLTISDVVEEDEACRDALRRFSARLYANLSAPWL